MRKHIFLLGELSDRSLSDNRLGGMDKYAEFSRIPANWHKNRPSESVVGASQQRFITLSLAIGVPKRTATPRRAM